MKKDIVCNAFFSDNERYADIINGIGCKGIPFVTGKDLQELDNRVIPRGAEEEKNGGEISRPAEKGFFRDEFCHNRH